MSTLVLALDAGHALLHTAHIFLAQDPVQPNDIPAPAGGGAITITPIAPPGSNGLIRFLGWARWIFTIFAVLALFVAGGKFGFERWSHGAVESPKMVAGVIAGCIVVGAAPQIVYIAGS